MTAPTTRAYWLSALGAALLVWAALFLAPVDPSDRFHAAFDTDYIKAGWIYDRLYHDPTPIDVAFVGSSRMMEGVDSKQVEDVLDAATGRKLHVANLSLPDLGRDVPYLTLRMLLQTKHPSTVFLEANYIELGWPNRGFPLLTSGPNLLGMPWLLNSGLPYGLLYVPAHNAALLWNRVTRGGEAFDPAGYAGPHWNDTDVVHWSSGKVIANRDRFLPEQDLQRDAVSWRTALRNKAAQYDRWAWVQLRYNELILKWTVDAARAAGVHVVFLYMPPVGMEPEPFQASLLRQYGELWPFPPEIDRDFRLWLNPTHLNPSGARKLSDWVGQRLGAWFDHVQAQADASADISAATPR